MNLDAEVKQDREVIKKLNKKFSGFKQGECKITEVIKTYTSNEGHTFEVTSFEKEAS